MEANYIKYQAKSMLRKCTGLWGLLFYAASVYAQQPGWVLGDSLSDDGYQIELVADGGFVVAGHTASYGLGSLDFWLLRFDAAGNKLWSKTYGTPAYDQLLSLRVKSNGNFLLAGLTGAFGSGSEAALLYEIDTAGQVVWVKTIDYPQADHAHLLMENLEGGYYMVGHTDSKGDLSGDVWAAKLDSAHNVLWDTVYGPPNLAEHAHSAVLTPDSGLLIFAHTNDAGFEKFKLVKADKQGNKLWETVYGSNPNKNDTPYEIRALHNGSYALLGTSAWPGGGIGHFWLLIVDTAGNVLLDKHYGGNNYSFCWTGRELSDNGFLIAGYKNPGSNGLLDMLIIRLDSIGNTVWQREYGGSGYDVAYGLIETEPNRFVVTGSTTSFNSFGTEDLWAFAIDAAGNHSAFGSLPNDAGIYTVNLPSLFVCDTVFTPSVVIKNYGTDTLFSTVIYYRLNNQQPFSYTWSGSLPGQGMQSVVLPPVQADTFGKHQLKVWTYSPNGVADLNPFNDEGETVLYIDTSILSLPFYEGFENLFPPVNGWKPQDNCGLISADFAGGFGNSAKSALFSFYNAPAGNSAMLLTPSLQLPANALVQLSFNMAYAYTGLSHTGDTFSVKVSTDCGNNWSEVFRKGGSALATAPVQSSAFYPSAQQWRTEYLDLSTFAGQKAIISMEGISRNGNNLYIDDLNMAIVSSAIEEKKPAAISVYPNPVSNQLCIETVPQAGQHSLELYNAQGQLQVSQLIQGGKTIIDVSGLTNGFYYLKTKTPQLTQKIKVTVYHP